MKRDFICIVGNQGCGKSVWTKQYCSSEKRLLAFDPAASFPRVDFMADPENWVSDVVHQRRAEFAYGTIYQDELPMFANTAMAAGKCTFAIEECALVFSKGGDCPDWAKPLVFMGRHPEVNLLLVAQRAISIPIDLRSQASRIVSFRQTEQEDVNAICNRIGKQYRDVISSLPDLTCIDWDAGRQGDPVKIYPIKY